MWCGPSGPNRLYAKSIAAIGRSGLVRNSKGKSPLFSPASTKGRLLLCGGVNALDGVVPLRRRREATTRSFLIRRSFVHLECEVLALEAPSIATFSPWPSLQNLRPTSEFKEYALYTCMARIRLGRLRVRSDREGQCPALHPQYGSRCGMGSKYTKRLQWFHHLRSIMHFCTAQQLQSTSESPPKTTSTINPSPNRICRPPQSPQAPTSTSQPHQPSTARPQRQ